jgi:plastocyanin
MNLSYIQSCGTHRFFVKQVALTIAGLAIASQVQAGLVVGFLTDKNGQALPDAVLFATPLDTPLPATKATEPVIVAQENSVFVPYVSVIQSGTSVRFPNRDPHDHHLKSFSAAKSFELRVYGKRDEPAPVLFDKTGEVALVCHFHDWMRGFVYVVDTPYFAKTDKAGNALLNNLAAGRYEVKAWAPNMLGAPLTQTVQVTPEGSTQVKFQFNYVPKAPPAPRPPSKIKTESSTYY